EYNAGSRNVEDMFNELIELVKILSEEEQRYIAENLTEEELSIFDLLTKPDMHLTKKEEQQVKEVVKELLTTLTHEKLVLDWKKKQQARAEVKTTVEDILDHLPEKYSAEVYQQKCEIVFSHIYDSYNGAGQGIYA
ncbi:MAG: type I restriction enzyme endonuclease domain-containing protein, partial [Methanosarcina sp.]